MIKELEAALTATHEKRLYAWMCSCENPLKRTKELEAQLAALTTTHEKIIVKDFATACVRNRL